MHRRVDNDFRPIISKIVESKDFEYMSWPTTIKDLKKFDHEFKNNNTQEIKVKKRKQKNKAKNGLSSMSRKDDGSFS